MITMQGIAPRADYLERVDVVSYRRTESILIIEDEEDLRNSLGIRLRSAGFIVELAGDGTTGVEMLRQHRPELLMLDLCLPGMSGFRVLEAIRDDPGLSVPVLVITGNPDQRLEEKLSNWDVQHLLRKPFRPHTLLTSVRAAMEI